MLLRRVMPGICTVLFALAAPLAAGAAQSPDAKEAGAAAPAPYTLSAGETVRIVTYGEEALTGEYTVAADGSLPFPLVGSVPAEGKTAAQLGEAIQARLAQGYLINPRVSVEVKSYKPVYVLGEVNKPGEYAFVPGMTVQGVVAKAQGFTYRAQQKRVFVKRAGQAEEVELKLSGKTQVLPGDTIRVAERYF